MTKREITQINKEALDELLQENDLVCSEILNLFSFFTEISVDYLNSIDDLLFNYEPEFEYEKVDICDTITLVREFLGNIDDKYLEKFDKALNDGTFELFLPDDDWVERPLEPITIDKPEAIIYVPINYNITDGTIIIHEFFHYLNDQEKQITIRDIFTEMISIYYELRFSQFLDNKGISTNGFNKNVCDRLYNTMLSAENVFFTGAVFDIYHNTGKISKKNINFIDKYRHLYLPIKNYIVNFYSGEDFIEDMLSFRNNVSYVIGTLLSFYSLKEFKIGDIRMHYINDNMNEMNIKETLEYLNTDFDCYQDWIKDCFNSLKKAQGEVYGKSYCYSRANGGRENKT